MPVTVETPVEKWAGTIRPVAVGATAGEGGTAREGRQPWRRNHVAFPRFRGPEPERAAGGGRGLEPQSRRRVVGSVDPGVGRRAQRSGAVGQGSRGSRRGPDLPALLYDRCRGRTHHREGRARATLRCVLEATKLPVIVLGPGQAELDNEVLVACAEEGAGEKLVLGPCEDKNYRTIVAAAMANGHLVTAKTPMDVNLAKQLNILIHDMGMPMERIVLDPTTGLAGLWHRVRLQRDGTPAAGGAPGRRHDPTADAGDPWRGSLAGEGSPHG